MSHNIELREIDYEEIINEENENKRLIFDINKYDKIRKENFTLSKDKVFKQPIFEKLKRIKNEILVISDKEQAIDISQTVGKTVIPLLNKDIVKNEIEKINKKDKVYRNIELAATEIIIKAYFQQGIDTPIELMLVDERIIEPIEKAIITRLRGNLIYQKVRFIVRPDYSISISDKNIDKSYVLYYKLNGINMKPGSKVISVRCKNAYIISTHHTVNTKNKLKPINIDRHFLEILKPIEFIENKRFIEPDDTNELQIALERNNSLRMIPSTSQINNYHIIDRFYIIGKIKDNNETISVLIDTGSSINFINIQSINIDQIQISNQKFKGIEKEEYKNSQGKTNQIIIIAGQEILIEFEIITDESNKCILGTAWLESVKPWKLENDKLTFTYKNIEFNTKRIKI